MKTLLTLLMLSLWGSHALWSDYCSDHFAFTAYDSATAEVVCGDVFAAPVVEAARQSLIDGEAAFNSR